MHQHTPPCPPMGSLPASSHMIAADPAARAASRGEILHVSSAGLHYKLQSLCWHALHHDPHFNL